MKTPENFVKIIFMYKGGTIMKGILILFLSACMVFAEVSPYAQYEQSYYVIEKEIGNDFIEL